MTDLNQPANTENWLEEPKKLPSMLNVLTILTFISCGLGVISLIFFVINPKKSYDQALASQDKMDQLPSIMKTIMGPDPVEVARRTYVNYIPIIILGLLAVGLCTYGAIQMRKLKKTGFTLYAIGELLPIASVLIFIGTLGLEGPVPLISYIIFPILFLILYATQLKYMSK
jgi:hypothetical protein